jgi:hypothetical protein
MFICTGNNMIRKPIRIGLTVTIVIVAWFYLLPYARFIASPFSWKEADIDKRGFVSPTEADYFADYGKKQHTENGKECTEYYALKDGLTLKKEYR